MTRHETNSPDTPPKPRQPEPDLITIIDSIREAAASHSAMMDAIVCLVADVLDADLCLLVLLDPDTGKLELEAVNDWSRFFGKLSVASFCHIAYRAIRADDVQIWQDDTPYDAVDLDPFGQKGVAVVPIDPDAQTHPGALIVARADEPFSAADLELLRAVQSRLDPALIRCREGAQRFALALRERAG
jgi:GAF domain-containing protein